MIFPETPGRRGFAGFFRSLRICVIAWLLSGSFLEASPDLLPTHKIQVSDPAFQYQIEAQGGVLIADYGSYRLYEITNVIPKWLADHPRAELRDDYNIITLHAGHLDTRLGTVKALRKSAGDFNGRHLHLVQFAGPVQPQWRNQLLAAGARIISYIPENSYLIYGDASTLAQIQALASAPHFQWEGKYEDSYKIHPLARTNDTAGNLRVIGTDFFEIQLVDDDEANATTLQLLDRLKLEPFKRNEKAIGYLNLVVRLHAEDVPLLSAQPEVVSIMPFFPRQKLGERQDEIIAGNLTAGIPNGPGYIAWLQSLGFGDTQFTNIAVDVTDSGIDNGTTAPGHFGLYRDGNFSGTSRVIYNRLEGSANSGSTLQGCDGHGNLNSHIIGGYDDYTGFPFTDSNGYHYGLGVCPFVSVGSSVIFDPTTYTFPSFTALQSQAYHSGARVSNNSWGENGSKGAYDSEAQVYDSLVRDAEQTNSTYPVSGNQPMVIVFAAGNSGPSSTTINSPGSAKNVITVGAADSVQPFGGSDNSGITDADATNAENIAYFSSMGPCADGRIKPDLVAPGVHISGGVFQATNDFVNYPDGIAGACFTGSDVSGGTNGSVYWPEGQQFYTASDGTSHSTPCVSGGCALVMQYFLNHFSTNLPSPAMTKAYLMNSARYLTGNYANDTLPSDAQGTGEMNLGTAFDGTPRILRDQLPFDLFTASGQSRTIYGSVTNTNEPFCVTLAWTDAPGSTSGNAYNNNLDLVVTFGTNVYKGNVFSGAYSVTGGSADVKNNVESIFLPPGTLGNFTVTVAATSINSIGVPNSTNAICQDFALVVYNANETLVPLLTNGAAVLTAENCSPTNGVIDPGETVTVSFTLQNRGTGATSNLTATLLPSANILSPSGPQNYGAIAANGGTNSQPFTFEAGGTCGGTITATFQLADGTNIYSNVNFTLPVGKYVTTTNLLQNFDAVTAPALPSGWTTTATNGQVVWVTATTLKDTAPNAAFAACPATAGVSELISPAVAISSTNAQLIFRNDYNFQNRNSSTGYDGGVFELQIGTNAYTDIVAAGGTFVSNGYNKTIYSSNGNPLAGRSAWGGNSSSFLTTVIRLPAAAAGQTVHFKWRCGSDNSTASTGWYIDTVTLIDSAYQCCSDTADLVVSQTPSPNPAIVGSNLTYSIAIANLGPVTASSVTVTDTLPSNITLVSATSGYSTNSGMVMWNLGAIASGVTNNLSLTVIPNGLGLITNAITVYSPTYDLNYTNNSVTVIIPADNAITITAQPTNQIVIAGSNSTFSETATGTTPIAYQWYFNALTVSGATNSSLLITNAQTNQAGNYFVVVSNPVTVVTSAVATLTVLTPPVLAQPLTNQTAFVGTNVTFTVGVTGQALSYQWSFNTTNAITDPTNALLLANVQPAQAGTYSVTVTNLAGSVSSSANLSLVLPPLNISVTGTNVSISLPSQPGLNYTLQFKNNLSDPAWTSVTPSTPGTGGIITLTDPTPAVASRFYRVVVN